MQCNLLPIMRSLFYIFTLTYSLTISSQILSGIVLDKKTKLPLEYAVIRLANNSAWGVANSTGNFSVEIDQYPITISIIYLGKKTKTITIKKAKFIAVFLEDDNLSLHEVIISAKARKNQEASIVLGRQAINMVQAQSLADVMQLLPGKNINESELHGSQILTLRSAIFTNTEKYNTSKGLSIYKNSLALFDINNAFGIGYLVDGIPISNDANMTVNNTNEFGGFNSVTNYNNLGSGLDLRSIALGNIEKIEIVQGIASAKYGNHTTGLIKIERSAGQSPYRVSSTIRPDAYSIDISKGIRLPRKNGFLNTSFNYLHSEQNPRNPLQTFNRIGANLLWSIYRDGFKNKFSLSFNTTIDREKYNPEDTSDKRIHVDKKRMMISNSSKWMFSKQLIDHLETSFAINYSIDKTSKSRVQNTGGNPIPNSLKEGLFELPYTYPNYRYYQNINSIPFYAYATTEIGKKFNLTNGYYSYQLGINLSLDDNFGSGTSIDSDKPLNGATISKINTSSVGYRPSNFKKQVKQDQKYSFYFINRIKHQFTKGSLLTDLGIRYNNYNGHKTISPRFNMTYTASKALRINTGIGYFSKAPALSHTNPGTVYYDFLLADKRTNTYSLALGQTFVRKHTNFELKPSRTLKIEQSIYYNTDWVNTTITSYYNKMTDGFTPITQLEKVKVPKLEFTYISDKKPSYKVVGTTPQILKYKKVVNGLQSNNYGFEFQLRSKKISSLNTRFLFSGAFRETVTQHNLPFLIRSGNLLSNIEYGYHKRSKSKYTTLKTRLVAIQHISKLGLVISLTAEQFFISTKKSYKNSPYAFAYLDSNLNVIQIAQEDRGADKYKEIRSTSVKNNTTKLSKPYSNYHIKISKEFENNLQFSFYAYNFLNHRPHTTVLNSSGEYVDLYLNRPISFGGKIQYQF